MKSVLYATHFPYRRSWELGLLFTRNGISYGLLTTSKNKISTPCGKFRGVLKRTGLLTYPFNLFRMMLRTKADTVITCTAHPRMALPALLCCRILGRKLVIDTVDLHFVGRDRGGRFIWIRKIMEKFAFRHADGIISMTQACKDYLESIGIKNKYFIMPNLIDECEVRDFEKRKSALKKIYGKEWKIKRKAVFFSAGRWFTEVKGRGRIDINAVDDLLNAFPNVLRHLPDTKLLIFGIYDGMLIKRVKGLGLEKSVIFGRKFSYFEDRHIAGLALADCFVITGKKCWNHELTDRSKFFEYMLSGKPVVSADFPPVREIFGNSALYYEPENIGKLSERIIDALEGKNASADRYLIKRYVLQRTEDKFMNWIKSL